MSLHKPHYDICVYVCICVYTYVNTHTYVHVMFVRIRYIEGKQGVLVEGSTDWINLK